jgi:hypothetical protein
MGTSDLLEDDSEDIEDIEGIEDRKKTGGTARYECVHGLSPLHHGHGGVAKPTFLS